MNTCSNCGAAVRPGAKFCTACGTRLNDASASAASSEWTSGQRTEAEVPAPETPDANRMPGETVSSHVEVRTVETPQPPDASSAPDSSEAAPAPWSWRSSSQDPETPAPAMDEGDEATTESASPEQPRVFKVEKPDTPSSSSSSATDSTEEFTWTWSSSGDADTDADPDTRTDPGNGIEVAAGVSGQDAGAEDTSSASTTDAQTAGAASDGADGSATSPETFWPSDDAASDTLNRPRETDERAYGNAELAEEDGPFQAREPDPEPATDDGADPVVTSPQPAAAAGDEDPLDRARRLIDELRTLIPPPRSYGEENQQASAPAISEGLRDDLQAARSSSDFGELRSTLESARARPRDVDTILELVGRIDTMLDALDERDRLAAAVDRALDRLGPEASGTEH